MEPLEIRMIRVFETHLTQHGVGSGYATGPAGLRAQHLDLWLRRADHLAEEPSKASSRRFRAMRSSSFAIVSFEAI